MESGEYMDDRYKRFDEETKEVSRDEEPGGQEPREENTESGNKAPSRMRHVKKDERLRDKNSKKLEKLLKKQRRRDERSNREVLSYEEMPLEEREEELLPEKKKNKKKNAKVGKIVAVALIIVLLFSVVFFAFSNNKFSWHNITNFVKYGVLNQKSDEKLPLDIKGVNVSAGNFIRFGQDICYTSDTRTQLLNNYGKSEFSVQHAYINPVITVGQKGVLVYNLGGSGYQIIDKKGKYYTGEAADNILVGSYGENGCYALVTQSSGYLSKLYVYNEKHEQIFAYSFADYYVTSVSLNSGGKHAVVAGVSAVSGVESASVYVLDFTKDTPTYFKELESNIIYDIEYLNDKYACAVGRSASYVINTSNGEIETNDYEGASLTAFDINTDTDTYTLSLSGSGDGRNCDIVSYSVSGSKEKSFSVEEKVIDLSTYKGRVALLTSDSVMLYSKDGKRYSEKELNSDPHSVVMYTTSNAYVLCTGYIDTVKL